MRIAPPAIKLCAALTVKLTVLNKCVPDLGQCVESALTQPRYGAGCSLSG